MTLTAVLAILMAAGMMTHRLAVTIDALVDALDEAMLEHEALWRIYAVESSWTGTPV